MSKFGNPTCAAECGFSKHRQAQSFCGHSALIGEEVADAGAVETWRNYDSFSVQISRLVMVRNWGAGGLKARQSATLKW